ncbi:MAG: NmrA/HSCARG family protein [Thermoplasmata archaeon]
MSESTKGPVHPPPKSLLVLVTGITGHQGGHLARQLLRRGHRIRAMTRNLQNPKLDEFRSKAVEFVPGSFDDPAAIDRAARGIDAMFLMGTAFEAGVAAETRQGIAAIDAAKGAGVPWLVYSSVGDANRQTGIPHFESKYAVEEHLRRSGMPYAVSAPTSFMENFVAPSQLPSLRQGKLAMGISPDRAVQMVALDDLSAFVTHLLENPSLFRGKRINVASDALSEPQVARIISELSGRTIEYQQIPIEVLRAQNADFAKMFEWLEHAGYTADIEGLRREYPLVGWQRFREWAARQDWKQLLT